MIKHCYFYNGENIPPYEEDDQRRLLWFAEKHFFETDKAFTDEASFQKEIASYVAAYVGTWAPYKYREIIQKHYLQHLPDDIKQFIVNTYEI